MAKTPTKEESLFTHMAKLEISNFTPRELTSPSKNEPGVSKTVFEHVSNLHSLLSKWIQLHGQGCKACNSISALKLHEYHEGYYPEGLEKYSTALIDIIDGMITITENVKTISNKLRALALAYGSTVPICTWSLKQFSDTVTEIHEQLTKEVKLKKVVTENVAHYRNENLIEVFVSAWEFNIYFEIPSTAYLFAEVGLNALK